MTRDDETSDPVDDARRGLPREVPPRRDLWPAIRREIARDEEPARLEPVDSGARRETGILAILEQYFKTPSWGLMGATAALACILGAGVVWLTMGSLDARVSTGVATPDALAATLDALEHECARVQADLLTVLERTEDEPGITTREILLANMAIIESAVAQSRAALLANPDDPHLADLTLSAYRERLAFLKGATRVPFGAPHTQSQS